MIDSNFWFYTLSAIPQTLAAVIALTATFVIFKLNHIESRTQKEYDEIKEWIMPLFPEIGIFEITKLDDSAMLEKLKEGIKKLDPTEARLGFDMYDKLCDLYSNVIASYKRKFKPTEQRIFDYLKEKERILESLLVVRKNSLWYLKASLFLTALPIVGAIMFLPLYEKVTAYALVIVLAIVILAVIAVSFTAYSVYRIAHPPLR